MLIFCARAIVFFALLFLPAAATPAAVNAPPVSSPPVYFTNAQNVRRIAAGRNFVAFATSGGLRVFERATGQWRTLTRNDGLPTHNLFDVVFDPDMPDTLWLLGGLGWREPDAKGARPALVLATVALQTAGATVRSVSVLEDAPPARDLRHYFQDYRLMVTSERCILAAGTEAGERYSVYDRTTRTWRRDVPAAQVAPAERPRPTLAENHWLPAPLKIVAAAGIAAWSTDTGAFLYDWHSHQLYRFTYPLGSQLSGLDNSGYFANSRLLPIPQRETPPFNLRLDPKTSRLTFSLVQTTIYTDSKTGRVTEVKPFLITASADPRETRTIYEPIPPRPAAFAFREITRRRLSDSEAARLVRQTKRYAPPPEGFLKGGDITDIVWDGGTIWFATYNHPDPNSYRGRFHAEGIARHDMGAKNWQYPPTPRRNLAANFVYDFVPVGKRLAVFTTNGESLDVSGGTYDFTFRTEKVLKSDALEAAKRTRHRGDTMWPYRGFVSVPYLSNPTKTPLPHVEGLQEDADQRHIWVRWYNDGPRPADSRFPLFPYTKPQLHLGVVDKQTRTLDKLENKLPAEILSTSVVELCAQGDYLYLVGSNTPDPRSPNPVLLVWNRKTGTVRRWQEGEWQKPVQEAMGNEQWDLQLRLFEAAGQVWLRAGQHLLRFVPKGSDLSAAEWEVEPLVLYSVYPDTDALYTRTVLPTPQGAVIQSRAGAARRWTPAAGWEEWTGGMESVAQTLGVGIGDYGTEFSAFAPAPDGSGYFVGGIGAMWLPRDAVHFTPFLPKAGTP